MKITDRKPVVLNVDQVRALPEFGKLNARQQSFVLLIAAGATPLESVRGAYGCTSQRSGERFLYGLLNRPSMRSVLNRVYGRDDKAAFLKRIDDLMRRGARSRLQKSPHLPCAA